MFARCLNDKSIERTTQEAANSFMIAFDKLGQCRRVALTVYAGESDFVTFRVVGTGQRKK